MAQPKTFFEQIPVENAIRIAKEFPDENTSTGDGKDTKVPDEATSPRESWRELVQEVQQERDPARMVELIDQLIVALDRAQLRKCPSLKPDSGNGRD